MRDVPEHNPTAALAYVGELVSEYMKTLPAPIRRPVVQVVNECFDALGKALRIAEQKTEGVVKDEIRG
jgi:hypothetical protein